MDKEEQVLLSFMNLINKMISLDKFSMKESLRGYKPSEVHCIEYIGRNADSNVTKLAEYFYMTRGAISKLTKKLIKKGVIEFYQKPDNKKEIYFRLTGQGKEVYKIHEELHKKFKARDKAVFEQIPGEHFDIMLNFAQMYNSHLDAEIKKLGLDVPKHIDFE